MAKLPKTTKIENELKDGWLTIWFNSPENRNALGDELAGDFTNTLKAVRNDRSVRGITMRGRHSVFCAGGDLKGFKALQDTGAAREVFYKMSRATADMFDLVMSMPQVVIAYVEGAAIAGGLGLMCCADIIVVHTDARFSLTETLIGIAPAQIIPIVIARAGLPRARFMMLSGTRFTGAGTPDYNLSDFVVADADEFAQLEAQLRKSVMKCAPGAIGITKEILLATAQMDRADQKDFAANRFADCLLSAEGREGIASFVEKRKPDWAP